MPFPRPLIMRAVAAAGLTLLICGIAYLVLGWGVRERVKWLIKVTGHDRFQKIYDAYDRAAAAFMPADRDADGIPDGRELFRGLDLQNPGDAAMFLVRRTRDGITAYRWGAIINGVPDENQQSAPNNILVEVGERLRLQYDIGTEFPSRMPPGFKVRLKPLDGIRIAQPGGQLTSEAVDLNVSENGTFAFDLQLDPSRPIGSHNPIGIYNATTGFVMNFLFVYHVQRLQTMIPDIEPVPAGLGYDEDFTRKGHAALCHFKWPAFSTTARNWLLEAARDEEGADWHPIDYDDINQTTTSGNSYVIKRVMTGPLHPYTGPIKFRLSAFNYIQSEDRE